ncbi:type-1 angiotensin II receptor-like [Saccostrea echinata]|uniref:type-1 angiotensin II receptor-like n=1 Tax=Saccostrea echinata TaxID=191078 RepID=UPI002A81D6FA|nr:type-1 angiotensin II receptor-like [Saccostrea echinata]
MASYKRIMVNTSLPFKWNPTTFDKETTLNHTYSEFRYSMSPLTVQPLQKFWNETQNFSAEHNYDGYYNKDATVSLKFFLIDSRRIDLTSERFQKSIVGLSLILGLLGFLGNVVTISKILCDKKLHTPTYVAIGCLAFPDTLNIVTLYLTKFSNLALYAAQKYVFFGSIFEFITVNFLFETIAYSSSSHIIFLSIIRYLLTVHPLRSKVRITASFVMCCSVVVWILCLVPSTLTLLMILWSGRYSIDKMRITSIPFVLMRVALCGLIPICVIIALHLLKMKALRKSSVTNSISKRMDVIISIILSVFICYQISKLLFSVVALSLLFSMENSPFSITHHAYTFDIAVLFGFLNFSCYPYILFLSSMILTYNKSSQTKKP